MAEFTYSGQQTVSTNANVLFEQEVVGNSNCIKHRDGSGIVTLNGTTNQCKARFLASFAANIAVPDGGTAGEISLALALDGEAVLSSEMISTPTATATFNNVASNIYIDVPRGCCASLSVYRLGFNR